ncbi:MAG: hypothetical protein U0835_24300 [Isosphaeraceae bacterium]
MSIRPQVRGFDLGRFGALFGSGDEAVVAEVEGRRARLHEGDSRPPSDGVEEAYRAILRRAVFEGVPFPELAEESHLHVQVANDLAATVQDAVNTDSDFWTWQAFRAFWQDHAASLDPRGRSLFSCFLKGRPVFGKKIASDIYYGYLNHNDTATLRDSLQGLMVNLPDDARAFAADMSGWLGAVVASERDLWFHFL